jgi:hypothetical protein
MIKIMESHKTLETSEFLFFISPITINEEIPTNLLQSWLPNDVWRRAFALSRHGKRYEGLLGSLSKKADEWRIFFSNPKVKRKGKRGIISNNE